MKRVLLLLFIAIQFTNSFSQGFVTYRYRHDNKMRKIIYYVPQKYYDENVPVPMLFALHGFGDNIDNFSNIGFHRYADTANFIVVYPEALPDPLLFANAWNSGAALGGQIPFNNTVDDVGFLRSLMDSMEVKFQIDTGRIYFTGFSFGAFMCNRMACEARDKVVAIASVSGTVGSSLDCQPGGDIPVLHFHGNSDNTISYLNNPYGKSAVNNVKFWAQNNECNMDPDTIQVPDVMNDGRRIEHYIYRDCVQGEEVEFYKIFNGEHEWLNSVENDISYNFTIWTFLRKWRRGNVPTGIQQDRTLIGDVTIFPNPSGKTAYLDISKLEAAKLVKLQVMDYLGRTVSENNLEPSNSSTITLEMDGNAGIYFIRLFAEDGKTKTVKWVRN